MPMKSIYTDEEQQVIQTLLERDIRVDWLAGLAPVQSTGWIQGHAYYFHARGASWEIRIAQDDNSANIWTNAWVFIQRYGSGTDASFMPFKDALGFIAAAAIQYQWEHPIPRGKGLKGVWRDFKKAIHQIAHP